jgi:hypothetical protein
MNVPTAIQQADVKTNPLAVAWDCRLSSNDAVNFSSAPSFLTLIVTRQPTIQVGALRLMTDDTKPHFKPFAFQAIHGFDRTMTFLTGDVLFNMALVVEKHVLRQIKYLLPGRGGFRIEIHVLFLNFRMIGDHILMAIQAFFDRGDSRMNRPAHVRMTKLALNIFNPRMNPMAEGDRLGSADIHGRGKIKKDEESDHKGSDQTHPEDQQGIFHRFLRFI